MLWSESMQLRITASPCRSAEATPGRPARLDGSTSGSVARSVRLPDARLDLGRRAVGDDSPVSHQDRAVGVRVGLLEVMGGEQHRLASGRELAHDAPELAAALDVQRDGRLVEHEQVGLQTIASANRTRWVWPPESLCVRWPAIAVSPVTSSASSTSIGSG